MDSSDDDDVIVISDEDEEFAAASGSSRQQHVEQNGFQWFNSDDNDDIDVIEILSDDLDDSEEVQLQEGLNEASAPKVMQAITDLCGSQPRFYEEAQQQRDLYNMYVDGSYRNEGRWPVHTRMSAGGYCIHPGNHDYQATWFNFSLLLLGGKPDSMRAELGAIWVGCKKLLEAVEQGHLGAAHEVHMYTDCQGAANALKRQLRKPPSQYEPLVQGIRAQLKQLKQRLPVRLLWIKGHQTVKTDGHGLGNDQADRRAQPKCINGAIHLPTGTVPVLGDPDHAATAAAALKELRAVLRTGAAQQQTKQHAGHVGVRPVKMKRHGRRPKGRQVAQAAGQLRNTAAQAAARRQQQQKQQHNARRLAAVRRVAAGAAAGPAAAPAAAAAPPMPILEPPICIDC